MFHKTASVLPKCLACFFTKRVKENTFIFKNFFRKIWFGKSENIRKYNQTIDWNLNGKHKVFNWNYFLLTVFWCKIKKKRDSARTQFLDSSFSELYKSKAQLKLFFGKAHFPILTDSKLFWEKSLKSMGRENISIYLFQKLFIRSWNEKASEIPELFFSDSRKIIVRDMGINHCMKNFI